MEKLQKRSKRKMERGKEKNKQNENIKKMQERKNK